MQLLIVDTTGIQPYIFGSNRLRENLGASHLVAQVNGVWAEELLTKKENEKLNVEVIYAGGGNFMALFHSDEDAKTFTRKLSQRVLTDAPGLQLIIAKQEFGRSQSLSEAIEELTIKLSHAKRSRVVTSPLLGLGVSVMCSSTGLPASAITNSIGDDPGYPASSEIHAKLAVAHAANERLYKEIKPSSRVYEYPNDFEELGGSKGEHSYIALVHADGNEIGSKIIEISKKSKNNNDHIKKLKELSDGINEATTKAMQQTLRKLEQSVEKYRGKKIIKNKNLDWLKIELKESENKIFLPFRPIVFGGDDVTFVCDGRLGLSLAIEYLKQFEQQTAKIPSIENQLTACAGIAIVKSHYPFARAYALAEELCSNAKKYRKEKEIPGSCFDWHFATSGLSGSIDHIRNREYKTPSGSLVQRPMTLSIYPKQKLRSWENAIQPAVNAFQGKDWANRRNKVKALRDALRSGSTAVEAFRYKYNKGEKLPEVDHTKPDIAKKGWFGDGCCYFDAIEMADWHIPLAEEQ